ncbi:hypothetical protein GCM10025331_83330 [Actinoplanes utahensis]
MVCRIPSRLTLRSLNATPTLSVTVSYEPTDLGLSPHRMRRGLTFRAEQHRGEVSAHRDTYDVVSPARPA